MYLPVSDIDRDSFGDFDVGIVPTVGINIFYWYN